MSKKGQKQDHRKQDQNGSREAKLRQRLADAQSGLRQAQEKRVQVMRQGERDVEKARQRAAQQLAKATERVEKRTRGVSDLESRILATHQPGTPTPFPPISPTMAAEELQAIEASGDLASSDTITIEAAEVVVESETSGSPVD